MATKRLTQDTDRLLRSAAERVLELAAERAEEVLHTAEGKAAKQLDAAGSLASSAAGRWHLGKEIPLALVGALIIQTAGVVWWLAQLSSNVGGLNTAFAEFKVERYTREDARRDRELQDQKLLSQIPIDRDQERRLNTVEARLDRIERK